MHFGIVHHFLDLIFGKSAAGSDSDLLFLAGSQIFSRYVENTVGIDIECHFDLGHAAGCGNDTVKTEVTQRFVISCHIAFTLHDVDIHRGLIVSSSTEHFLFHGGDSGIAFDHSGGHAAQSFDTQREGSDVKKNHVIDFSAKHTALNCGTGSNHFVRIDTFACFFTEDASGNFSNTGHSCHTANKDHFFDLALVDTGVGNTCFTGFHGTFDETVAKLYKGGSGKGGLQVEGSGSIHGDEGQIDFGRGAGGKFDLCLFSGFFQSLQCLGIITQIHTVFLFEVVGKVIQNSAVKVVTAQVGIAVGGFYFKHTVTDFQNGDIESSSAEVIYSDDFIIFLFKPVSKRSSGGFVDDTFHIQPCDTAGIFGSLTLGIIEVGGNSNDCFCNFFAQICFSIRFEFLKDHGGDLLGGVALVADLDVSISVFAFHYFVGDTGEFIFHLIIFASDEAFDGENSVFGVGHSLTFCSLTDNTFSGFGECHYGGSGVCPFSVGDDLESAAIHYSHATVGGAQVDTDDFSHNKILSFWLFSVQ